MTSLDTMKMGSIVDLKNILRLINLDNEVIDVFKMDIEGGEVGVFAEMDMSYACKYFKQIVVETHKNMRFWQLEKLEECFFLFYRHTRYFVNDQFGTPTGHRTEFQQKNYKLSLTIFHDELDMAEISFTSGELYFVNGNFL